MKQFLSDHLILSVLFALTLIAYVVIEILGSDGGEALRDLLFIEIGGITGVAVGTRREAKK